MDLLPKLIEAGPLGLLCAGQFLVIVALGRTVKALFERLEAKTDTFNEKMAEATARMESFKDAIMERRGRG